LRRTASQKRSSTAVPPADLGPTPATGLQGAGRVNQSKTRLPQVQLDAPDGPAAAAIPRLQLRIQPGVAPAGTGFGLKGGGNGCTMTSVLSLYHQQAYALLAGVSAKYHSHNLDLTAKGIMYFGKLAQRCIQILGNACLPGPATGG
jgi:hypothetical protein